MRVSVDEGECIGCGLCADDCPEVFEIVSGCSRVLGDASAVDEAHRVCVETAADVCPTAAIQVD